MKLLIATKNHGKFGEITEALHGLPVELVSLDMLGITEDVEEHEKTHEGNAVLKAQFFFKKTGLPTLAEDSGINVDAFPGELGVQTRRWAGLGKATDEEWIAHFMKQMEKIPDEKRGAEFVCVAALVLDDAMYAAPRMFRGVTTGIITHALEAPLKKGIPISSCFRPEGCSKVYAALAPEKKNRASHRGKAMREARSFLERFLV